MRYLSVCSGIEATTVAWHPLGWEPVAFAEIDAFPSAVLAHHYPSVPNWGDLTKFQEWPDACTCNVAMEPSRPRPVDHAVRNEFTGGWGHAGAGTGSDHIAGSGVEYCANCRGAIIDVLVGGTPCQSFSVAGLRQGLADPRGNLALTYLAVLDRYRPRWCVWENVPGLLSADDGRALGALLGGLGRLGYGFAWRVLDAQYFGLAQRRARLFVVGHLGDWRRAAAVLFERESLSGHPPPRREAGESITGPIAGCSNGGGPNGPGRTADDADSLVIAPTIPARRTGGGGLGSDFDADGGLVAFSMKDHGADAGEIAPTLRAGGHHKSHANAGVMPAIAFAENSRDELREMPYTGTLSAEPGMKQQTYIRHATQVRRLTARECERLMGFPDDYTLIPYRGKPAADGPRYKALGNSMAVPVVRWIGERTQMVEELD